MAVAPIAFDTHRFVKRLTGAGMDERQAEVLADEQVALLNANLATKAELSPRRGSRDPRKRRVESASAARWSKKAATA